MTLANPVIIRVTEERTVIRVETVPRIIRVSTPGLQGPPGPPGPPGEGSEGGSYTHTQSTPETVWTIVHGFGRRPVVAVEGPDGFEIDAGVSWPDTNTVIVTLGAATAGRAHLS
ncbi:hypothetical protein [Streptosporangium roseum]|uniref:hypothetical protein n=1 Tax=Streptosporangium roseum TaxID=2001 RepID=UPI00331AEA70